VGFPHVRVGHRQASKKENPEPEVLGVFYCLFGSSTDQKEVVALR
jgi:hypothetical protein